MENFKKFDPRNAFKYLKMFKGVKSHESMILAAPLPHP